MGKGPIFLERDSYRLRRMLDAIRLLPWLGVLLWMVPLLWPHPAGEGQGATDPMPMSTALQYLFGVWVLLVGFGWVLWRRTASRITPLSPPRPDEPD